MSKIEALDPLKLLVDEILEEQLVDILDRYHYFKSWKEVELEELIKNAQSEKTLWENTYSSYARRLKNDMTRIIEISETLMITKEVA